MKTTTEIVAAAAEELAALAEARYLATRQPRGAWRIADRAPKLAAARDLVVRHRATAVALLRLAARLVPFEALPLDVDLPEWPRRREHGECCDGLDELAEIVAVAAESGSDDDRFAEELRGWCRELASLREEAGVEAERCGGATEAEVEAVMRDAGVRGVRAS
jgi:hypothetical protein